jgi:hypothetical protein
MASRYHARSMALNVSQARHRDSWARLRQHGALHSHIPDSIDDESADDSARFRKYTQWTVRHNFHEFQIMTTTVILYCLQEKVFWDRTAY